MAFFCAAAVAWQQKILCAKLKSRQFRFEPHKFVAAELTPLASEAVKPARARECPLPREARVIALHELKGENLGELGRGIAAEVAVAVARVQVTEDFIWQDKYIDPAKWSPLIQELSPLLPAG